MGKATHAGHGFVKSSWDEVKKPEKWQEGKCVKDRCEPCHIRCVLEVVAGCKGVDAEVFEKQVYNNSLRVFFPTEAPEMSAEEAAKREASVEAAEKAAKEAEEAAIAEAAEEAAKEAAEKAAEEEA